MDQQREQTERPSAAERPQESGAAALGRGGRMSRQRKRDAVLRLLRGEELELVSRALGVRAATLSGWREAFLAAVGFQPTGLTCGEASPADQRRGAGERSAEGPPGRDAA